MSADLENKKILVTDNSDVMTKIITNNLVEIGFQAENIMTANDGHQAFLMLELVDFSLVTSSLHMRIQSGIDFLCTIRTNTDERIKNTPFLVISSEKEAFFIKELEALGIDGYLRKPFKVNEIKRAINNILNLWAEEELEPAPPPKKIAELVTEVSTAFSPNIIAAFVESTVEALGQYMVTTEAGNPIETDDLTGDFSSTIHLLDESHDVKLTLILYFPKNVACTIYEGIFGEVDMEQVCGIVQELGNIIAGNVKPRIAEFSQEIYDLVHPGKKLKLGDDNKMHFDLGLPVATRGDHHTVDIETTAPKFIIPFKVNEEEITMVSVFQKNSDAEK